MPSTQPIGVFDSGLGGLSVLRVIRRMLPGENALYLGDTGRLPYGPRSRETVIRYAREAAAELVQSGAKALVIACNTATVAALDTLRAEYPTLPVIGTVESGAQAAALCSRNASIVVLGTEGTINSGEYPRLINALRPEATVHGIAAPLLVTLAEEGTITGNVPDEACARYLDPVFGLPEKQRPDCLVLACTHFPFLVSSIRSCTGPGVQLIDPADHTVRQLEKILEERQILGKKTEGHYEYRCSADPDHFARIASLFMESPISPNSVGLVSLGAL